MRNKYLISLLVLLAVISLARALGPALTSDDHLSNEGEGEREVQGPCILVVI